MLSGIGVYQSPTFTFYNGTGGTINPGTRLTIAQASDLSNGLFTATVTGNGAVCHAVAVAGPVADGAVGTAQWRMGKVPLVMIAAASFSAGASVTAAASGKISTGGGTAEGVSIEAATADGDLVHVLPA